MLPALDVGPRFWTWGAEEVAIDVLHHAVYAVATGVAYDLLDEPPAPTSIERILRRTLLCCALALLGLALANTAARAAPPGTRDVLVVGNNWDGTADLVDPHTFERLTRLNIVPDLARRRAEILADPVATGFFLGINLLIGEGHDQLVDDAFTSADGTMLYVSRPSLADVVGIDLRTRRIDWRAKVDGVRSDHMAISPDGRRLLVSSSGDQPHETNFSADGRRIYHASIGMVFTPLDSPALDSTKGERVLQVVDAQTLQVLKRVDVGKALADNGFPGISSAVRPMALSPDERFAYLQLSFLHGFVEFDLANDRPVRVAQLPVSEQARTLPREAYLLDSAHHGIAMNPEGTRLCVAGTMSDYAAIVNRDDFSPTLIDVGRKPYWATNSAGGRYCFVSASGDDRVAVISYEDARLVRTIPVGDHPQRMRTGVIRADLVPPPVDQEKPRITGARVRRGVLSLRVSEEARVRVVVQRARRGGKLRTLRILRRPVRAGVNRVRLGKLGGPGRFRLSVSATDAAANRSSRMIVRFVVR